MRQDELTSAGKASDVGDAPCDSRPEIYVVDQDRSLRLSLTATLGAAGYAVRTFERAEDFLARLAAEPQVGCLLVDVRLPGMSVAALQRAIRRAEVPIGVIFMSGQADLRTAVAAIRGGAIDFIEKPVRAAELLTSIRAAILDARQRRRDHLETAETLRRFDSLTVREREVMRLMIEGNPTKIAARRLGLSPRTVESHRTRIMEKMGSRTLSELIRHGLVLERLLGRPSLP
jgi:FixJ family two-component response regulator